MIESKFVSASKRYNAVEVVMHNTEKAEDEANLAFRLIERWGLAASDDGEDSLGKQKLRMQTPEELVDRAFDVAERAFRKARKSNLIHNIGSLPETLSK